MLKGQLMIKKIALYHAIADKVRAAIQKDPSSLLPSIGDMAAKYDVAYQTMRKAIELLVKEGLIMCKTRRGLTLAKTGGDGEELGQSAQELYNVIESKILDGTFLVGHMLPKTNYFSLTYRISSATVAQTLQALQRENRIHKKGKSWYAGPLRETKKTIIGYGQPKVLVVADAYEKFWRLVTSVSAANFSGMLHHELENFGYQTEFLFLDQPTRKAASFEQQLSERMATAIDQMENRYSGCLLMCHSIMREPLNVFLTVAEKYDQPAAMLDHVDGGRPLLKSIKSKKRLVRFFFNEYQANLLALKTLYEAGHRKIGYPYYDKNPYQWVANRLEVLNKIAATQFDSPPQIIPFRQNEEPWYPRRWTGIAAPASSKPSMNAIRAGRAGLAPVRQFIKECGITAIILPNDVFAHQWYFWLFHLDIDVPKDISLISFDNAPELRMLPVSTIDFGFSRLGYLAAHLFIVDIPVRADADGNIGGISKLINRGSIASI